MPIKGTDARIFIDELDFSSVTSELSVEATVGELDATNLASTFMEYKPSTSSGQININGYFVGPGAGTGTTQESVLYGALANPTKTVAAVFDYQNLPTPAYVMEKAYNQDMKWTVPFDGLLAMTGAFKSKVGLKRGYMIYYKVNKAATGLGTAVQIPGVLGSHSGKIFAFVQDKVGTLTPPITFTVQTSADGVSGWTTKATFSMTALGAQVQSFSSPTGAYFNVNLTSLGGLTSLKYSIIVVVDGLTS